MKLCCDDFSEKTSHALAIYGKDSRSL